MTPPRIFRLFLSSTFSDFIEEREALQKHVFPDLEDYCARRGSRFQAVDLRWGITEEAQRDRETLQICLEEVRRCQELSPRPNFAILLGHRYGWEPVPERISEDHWKRLVNRLEGLGARNDKNVLESVYLADNNTVPKTYCLKPGDIEIDEADIQAILRRAAAHFVGSDRLPYFGSATHQEIAAGALGVEDASEHVHAYIRRIKNPPTGSSATDFIDLNDSTVQRLDDLENELRDRLAAGHVHEFDCAWNGTTITRDHIKNFCDEFYAHQVALIDQELGRIKQDEAEYTANSVHHAFAKERTEIFIGRESILDQISEYLRFTAATSQSPLIVVAEGGAGKTSIMARSYLQATETPSPSISPVVLCRFIGGAAGVESLKGLLESLISDINAAYGIEVADMNQGVNEASTAFKAALDHATTEKPLWIFVDALDQLDQTDNLPLSDWLPETLPAPVRLVLSVREEMLPTAVLVNRSPKVIEIDGMALDEGDTLLSRWLAASTQPLFSAGASVRHGRTLTPTQRNLILGRFQEYPNPLWLKLACEEARRWHSDDGPGSLPDTVARMIERFIGNYLLDQRKHPPIFTRKALSYIAAGRYGLSEEEIAEALGTDPEVRKEFEDLEKTSTKWESEDRLPPIIWSRLFLDLRPYLTSALTDGALLYRYFHREFKQTIEGLYFEGKQKALLHNHLAEVFSKPDASDFYRQTDAFSEHQDSRAMRRIMEQPWQLAEAGDGENLRTLLMDFAFCMAKCAANRSEDLSQDYRRSWALQKVDEPNWQIWSRFMAGRNSLLLAEGDQFWPAHRILLQFALEQAANSHLALEAKEWAQKQKLEWECYFLESSHQQVTADNCIAVLQSAGSDNLGTTCASDGRIISWSKNGSLTFWSANTGQRLQVICGHADTVNGLITLSDSNLLSYSNDHTLKLWSKEGNLLIVFEGHEHSVTAAQETSSGRLLSWSFGESARLWSKDGTLIAVLRGPVKNVKELASGHILTWSHGDDAHLWSEDGTLIANLPGPVDNVEELASGRLVSWSWQDCSSYCQELKLWSPTAKSFTALEWHGIGQIVGCHELEDGRLIIWSDTKNPYTSVKLWSEAGIALPDLTYPNYPETVGAAARLNDGRLLYWSDETLKLLSPNAEFDTEIEGDRESIRGAKRLSNGNIFTWSNNGLLQLWSPRGECLAESDEGSYVTDILELADGRIVAWCAIGWLKFLSPCGELIAEVEGHSGFIGDVLELKSGQLLSHSWDGTLRLWSASGEPLTVMEGHRSRIEDVRELCNGHLLSRAVDSSVILWNPIVGETIDSDSHAGASCRAIELRDGRLLSWSDDGMHLWSPDLELIKEFNTSITPNYLAEGSLGARELNDGRLLSWGPDGELQLWSSNGEPLADLDKSHGSLKVGAEELSDGRIISWSPNGTLDLWSSTGEHLSEFGAGSEREITAQELSEGKLPPLYTAQTMGGCWDYEKDDEVFPLRVSHCGWVNGVTELSDGRLLSWSDDCTLRIWSSTGTPLALLQGHSGSVAGARELEDGRLESWSHPNEKLIWSSSGECLGVKIRDNYSTTPGPLSANSSGFSNNELSIWDNIRNSKARDVKISSHLHCIVKTKRGEAIAFVGFSKIYPAILKKFSA